MPFFLYISSASCGNTSTPHQLPVTCNYLSRATTCHVLLLQVNTIISRVTGRDRAKFEAKFAKKSKAEDAYHEKKEYVVMFPRCVYVTFCSGMSRSFERGAFAAEGHVRADV